MNNLSEHIRQLIASDKLEKAIDALSAYLKDTDADLHNEALAHKATLTKNKRDSRRGLISGSEENQTRTRVRFAVLEDLLPAIEEPHEEAVPASETPLTAREQQRTSTAKTVFISYNHGDSPIANKLKDALRSHGIEVTIDSEAMKPGTNIQAFIEQSIRESDVTLSIVSNKSLLSAWVAIESINTFYHEKFSDEKMFIACFVDDDFFQTRFRLDATKQIDQKIKEIDELLPEYIENKIDTVDLNNQKTRLYKLRSNLGDILVRLKESLCLDIREGKFDESVAEIISAIKGDA